jgi:hypothetical protein
VRRLAGAGHEVAEFHRSRPGTELPEGVGQFLGDRQELEDYADELRSFGPEVVLDMIPTNEKDAQGVVEVFRDVARRTIAWERAHPPGNVDPASFDYAADDAALFIE